MSRRCFQLVIYCAPRARCTFNVHSKLKLTERKCMDKPKGGQAARLVVVLGRVVLGLARVLGMHVHAVQVVDAAIHVQGLAHVLLELGRLT